jgi:hypothetical protein
MTALSQIELFAGIGPNGQPVAERLQVRINEANECQLVRSPAFIKGLASGDWIKLGSDGQFELLRRSGNLCIRVFCREDAQALSEQLSPALETLGGELDLETPRLLVYSAHVSLGFSALEAILAEHLRASDTWLYGNVYDPNDGQTPLNWWQPLLEQV